MAGHRFKDYSAAELDACGRAFLVAFSCERHDSTKETTEAVKQFFAATAAPGVSVLGCNGRPELMLDQCHISYAPRAAGQGGLDYWDSILTKPVRLHLALESEWGKFKSTSLSLVDILDDAQKLALVRADAKVLLFASRPRESREPYVSRIERVRTVMADDRPWLWIDLPWDVCAERSPVYDVIAS